MFPTCFSFDSPICSNSLIPTMKSFTALVSLATLITPGLSAAISLGVAKGFAIVAGNTIFNAGDATIIGNIGAPEIIGLTSDDITGTVASTENAFTATADVTAAVKAAIQPDKAPPINRNGTVLLSPTALDGDVTLTAAAYVYEQGASIDGTTTLSGPGTFTFAIPSILSVTDNSQVILTGGATVENVFFMANGTITLGADSLINGNLISKDGNVVMESGATVVGTVSAGRSVIMEGDNSVTA